MSTDALRLGPKAAVLLAVTSMLGLVAFVWPLLAQPAGAVDAAHASDAPWLMALLVPLLLALILAEVADGSLDAKGVAVLGVLAACGAALRLPSGGTAGFEPVFFLLFPAGRVLGRGFGFVLGAVTLFASALLTGGIGPWLPFQMLAAAWLGFGAGCLPRGPRWRSRRAEVALLAAYAAVASLVFGLLLDLWFWPFGTDGTSLAFVPGDPIIDNLRRFWAFHLSTAMAFDLGRAVTSVVLVLACGAPVLAALRRVAKRASFSAAVVIEPAAKVSHAFRGGAMAARRTVNPQVEGSSPSPGAAGRPVGPPRHAVKGASSSVVRAGDS